MVTFNVRLTLKDIRDFCYLNQHPVLMALKILCFLFIIVGFIAFEICMALYSIKFLLIYMISTLLILTFIFFTFFYKYFTMVRMYKKSKLLGIPQKYEVSENGIHIISEKGFINIKWDDIYKLKELRTCFLLYTAPFKTSIIPKRCFNSSEQLNLYNKIMVEKLGNKKLELKFYKLKYSKPDDDIPNSAITEIENLELNNNTNDYNSYEQPLFSLEVLLTKNELMKINYKMYYLRPFGIILTLIGIRAFYVFITSPYDNSKLVILGIGAMFLFLVPIGIYLNVNKFYKHNKDFKTPTKYYFFDDYVRIEHTSGKSQIKWSDFVKINEVASGYMMYVTSKLFHFIPRRVFINSSEFDKFREMLINTSKKHNLKAKLKNR